MLLQCKLGNSNHSNFFPISIFSQVPLSSSNDIHLTNFQAIIQTILQPGVRQTYFEVAIVSIMAAIIEPLACCHI